MNIPTQKLCIYIYFVYKYCTKFIQLMYTKCIQNVSHISKNFCTHFVLKIKRTVAAKFCIQNAHKSLKNVGYILYTFCMHQF